MYKTFFGLEEAPFNLTPDPRFLFLSQRHREAIAALMFGINERKGFIALTGEIGSGKTTICRALMNELTSNAKVALIFNPALSEVELLQNINEDFGIPHESDSKKDLLSALNTFLLEQRAQGNTCILIIDESQNLSPGVLEQVRMISNLETETDKLIQIVLMGQPELADTLAAPELEQLNQRITVRYHITPLTEEETAQYIRHRMFVAKAKVDIHLETPALRAIYDFTKGIPRRINVLMDHVLLNTYVRDSYTITEDVVRAALAEVRGHAALGSDGHGKRRRARPGTPGVRSPRRGVRAVAAVCVTILVAGAAIVATQLVNLPGNLTSVFAGLAPSAEPPVSVQVLPEPSLPDRLEVAPVAYSITHAAEPTLAAVATNSLAAPPVAIGAGPSPSSWVYDQSGICRVSNPAEAWQACLVTLMSMTSLQRYDLTPLRDGDDAQRQRAIEAIYGQLAGQGHRQVRMSGSLASLLRCEQPMILTLAPNERLSPFAVLVGAHPVNGEERLILFDPVHGLTEMTRTQLGPLYQGQAVTVYRDPLGLGEIQPGETSDRVTHLQRLLAASGHYAGPITGQCDATTREAVREFQRDHHLEASGAVDLPTTLQLVLLDEQTQEAVQ